MYKELFSFFLAIDMNQQQQQMKHFPRSTPIFIIGSTFSKKLMIFGPKWVVSDGDRHQFHPLF